MTTFHQILTLLIAVTFSLNVYAWPWSESSSQSGITWRNPSLSKTNVELNRKCNAICKKHREEWTTNWDSSWLGQSCECKARPRSSWFFKQPEGKKPENIEYRPAGSFSTSQELQQKCAQVCEEHAEQYTGSWKHHWFRGYLCECKKD